ncbi:unnamed protein product, partial [Symbiodinium necroappetens]
TMENWSWKTGYTGKEASWTQQRPWQKAVAGRGERSAYNAGESEYDEPYYPDQPEEDKVRDRKGEVEVVGEDTIVEKEKKTGGRVSSTYPPTFRAKPQESYAEWKRAVEFWIGGEGSQLPPELVGPRMMVQLRDRAAQLVKRLSNADVNGPDGKEVIFRELEKSPLIKQVDKHKSVESYITRASLYRGQLLGLDSSLAMGEAFYVGHLLDHAHLSRRDRAMIKTKAGTDTDENLVTCAMVELACEGEPGHPLGMSEPTPNGEEWLLQRGEHRNRFQGQGPGRNVSGAPGSRAARQSFAADWEEASENPVFEEGEDSLDEGDMPPELLMRENEAFRMQYKAKQKIEEVKKLRQYYRKPDNDAKRKALAEQMKVNPCHNCGELGSAGFCARARAMKPVLEELADREWDLLLSMCSRGPQSSSDVSVGPRPAYKGHQHHDVHHVVHHVGLSMNEVEGYEVMWSVQELAFKIILDIGCMRSVAGVHWANLLVSRWKEEGRWLHVEPERETFKFGGGEVLVSRFRVSFVGSFAGRPVLYGFSIVEGNCPPLFSRSGCTQLGASIDCEKHAVSSRKLGVKNFGVGQDSGHYTLSLDECEPHCVELPADFRMDAGVDAMLVTPAALRDPEGSYSSSPSGVHERAGDSSGTAPRSGGGVQRRGPGQGDGARRGDSPTESGPPRPEPKLAVKGRRATPTMGSSEGYILVEETTQGLTQDEITMLNKRRAKQAASKAQAIQKKALTGVHADYPSLSHAWSNEVALNLVTSTASRMRTYLWIRIKNAVQADGDRGVPVRPLRVDASENAGPRDVELDVKAVASRPRPNRGLHQRLKAGVRQAKEALAVVERIVRGPGKKLCLEIFAGRAGLSARARQADGWMAAAPVDLATGWDVTKTASQRQLLELIEKCQPDLVLWRPPVGEAASPLASLEVDRRGVAPPGGWRTDGGSGAACDLTTLQLNFMKDREEVIRGVVPMCSLGRRDPDTKRPYLKKVVVESNCSPLIRYLLRGAYCTHKGEEHQPIRGFCRGDGGWARRSDMAARWPDKFCSCLLQAAEHALKQVKEAGPWAVHEATCGPQWETTLAVSSSTVPDEGLCQELPKYSMTGERYDFVCFDGAANQQPRRLRALVAHLHVALGHLSNERLGRTLSLSGASEAAVSLASSLSVNFAVTHYLDALTDYHVADLTDRPDSAFSREVFQDLWLAVFGPPDTLVTDGGPDFQGSVGVMLELLGIVQEVVPEGAKWRLGQAERHGAVLKLMMMKMVKGMGLRGLTRRGVTDASRHREVKFKYNEAVGHSEAIARAERIRIGAGGFSLAGLARRLEGAIVYVYEPPASRKGLARRMQDNSSWSGPGVIERDRPVPQRVWVRIRGRVKAFPLEKLRLATVDEMASSEFIAQAVTDVEEELRGGQLRVGAPEETEDPEAKATREDRAKVLDDLPHQVARNLDDKRKREAEAAMDPHTLNFQKKQKLFESLVKQLEPPTPLEEAGLRRHVEDTYLKFKGVRKAFKAKPKGGGERGGPRARHVQTSLVNDTLGQWSLWGESGPYAEHEILVQVSQKAAAAEMDGLTQVVTGKAYVEPLKKAVGVYLDHDGIKGVAKDQLVDPSRILSSRFVLTNKGGPSLPEAELRARWIFGGHKDPDAGLYATASPTASTLGHNLLNFVAVQKGWVVHYEDVSSAFLQGKALPRVEKVYVRVPHGYPPEVLEYLTKRLGGNVRPDLVELTKAGFGLPESPRLWYLEYKDTKDTIEALGLKELALVPGLFRAFHPDGALRAMASIHVDDTRYAGTMEMEYSMTEYTKAIPLAKTRGEKAGDQQSPSSATTTTSGGVSKVDGVASASTTTTSEGVPEVDGVASASTTATSEGVSEVDGVASGPLSLDAEVISLLSEKVVDPSEALTEGERKVISSVVGRLNWAARQGRYDLAFVSSSIQQLAGHGDPAALKVLNQGVKRAREDVVIPIGNLGCDLEDIIVVSVSDAAYGAMPGGHSQSGVLVLMASPKILTETAPVCALEGSSSKIQRVVRCSMSAEVSSLATCFEHGDFVRAVFCELIDARFQLRRWKLSVSRWPHYLVTDAKTDYDVLNNDTLPTDRKVCIDVAVLRQAIVEDDTSCFVRWVPGAEIPCDGLTKWADNHALRRLLTTGTWALVDSPEAQEIRRQAGIKRAAWRKAAKKMSQTSTAPEGL